MKNKILFEKIVEEGSIINIYSLRIRNDNLIFKEKTFIYKIMKTLQLLNIKSQENAGTKKRTVIWPMLNFWYKVKLVNKDFVETK